MQIAIKRERGPVKIFALLPPPIRTAAATNQTGSAATVRTAGPYILYMYAREVKPRNAKEPKNATSDIIFVINVSYFPII